VNPKLSADSPAAITAEFLPMLEKRRPALPAMIVAQVSAVTIFLLALDPQRALRANPLQRGVNDSGGLLIGIRPRPTP
jgi:hypothetical protein